MKHLPYEIWHQIGQFLSSRDLYRVISLNNAFYTLSMSLRYKMIEIEGYDMNWRRKLARVQDPMIGKYVQEFRLDIRPAYHHEAGHALDEFFNAILSTISFMPHLKHLALYGSTRAESFDLDTSTDESDVELLEFFASLWKRLNSGLRRLELSGSFLFFQLSIPQGHTFPSLEELHLTSPSPTRLANIANGQSAQDAIFDKLLPFINGLSEQLRVLGISTIWYACDLNYVFPHLGDFPRLEELILELTHLSSEHALMVRQFIIKEASVSVHLKLGVTLHLHSDDTLPVDTILSSTRTRPFPENITLSALTVVGEYYPITGLISPILKHRETLEHLKLGSFSASRNDTRSVLRAISKCTRLTTLCIRMSKVDKHLFLTKLSHVEKLEIDLWEGDMRMIGPWLYLWLKIHPNIGGLGSNWKLDDLSIYYRGAALDSKSMKSFSHHLPGPPVQSFWGTGDMESPPSEYAQWSHGDFVFDVTKSVLKAHWKNGVSSLRWLGWRR